jgi:hypothetical protein
MIDNWAGGKMEHADRLLHALTVSAAAMANDIAHLEEQQNTIRQELATARAVRAELLGAADALNRQRLG